MFYLLIDTCVWLDLAQDYQKRALIDAIEELIAGNKIKLIVPETVVFEFARNKARVAADSQKSLSSHFKRVKEIVGKFGEGAERVLVLDHLSSLDRKLPSLGETTNESIERIEAILKAGIQVSTTDAAKLRSAERAIDKRAPFHIEGKNSIGDALLVECYADFVLENTARGNRFAFITHNYRDFSAPGGSHRVPHPDIATLFSKVKSLYFLTLKEALNRIAPETMLDLAFVQEYEEEPRRQSEILEAIDEFVTKVWYNRHQIRAEKIEDGRIVLVEKGFVPEDQHPNSYIHRHIWEGALKAAEEVELRFEGETLLWSDFEWGMLNGKLSALRWVLGEEWDELYT